MQTCRMLLVTVLVSSCSITGRERSDVDLSNLVAGASENRAHMVRRFAGPHGLVGVVVQGNEPGARQTTGWVTADGEYLLIGNLFDSRGRAVADGSIINPGSSDLTSEDFFRRTQAADAVTQFPMGTRTVSVFADADCAFCWQMYQDVSRLSDEFEAASVRIRWVMVGTQSALSARRGAAILKQGAAGLAENEEHYNTSQSVGGITPVEDPRFLSMIRSNTDLLLQSPSGTKATPTLVWRSSRGVQTYVGAPDEAKLREMLVGIQPDRTRS